jgi:subtilase family serine protease
VAGSNIAVIPCGGGGAGAGADNAEGDLDIQMELGMAPLADIRVYDSPPTYDLIAVLAAEVNDNACDVISDSYAWSLQPSGRTAAHNLHLSMTLQGITYMAASGDSGTILGQYSYPDCEPEVLLVGGTMAAVDDASGRRWSEVAWPGSGGGWSNTPADVELSKKIGGR